MPPYSQRYTDVDAPASQRVAVLPVANDRRHAGGCRARALFDAAPGPKRLRVVRGVGHNDIVARAGKRIAEEIAAWVDEL